MKNKLYKLLKCNSVSGYEEPLQEVMKKDFKDYCDDIHCDATGNVIGIINRDAKPSVLLCAHADEIGFYINHICENGMAHVAKVGGIRPMLYLGTHVQIQNGDKIIPGVVITNKALEAQNNVAASDLLIDFGTSSKEETLKLIEIGNPVCAASDVVELQNGRIAGRALDDRACVYIISEATRRAKEEQASCKVFCASTTGEETTRKGAYFASTFAKADCAIIVDVTYASDYPGTAKEDYGDIGLDKGPVLCKSSTVNKKMNNCMQQLAKEHNIPVQWEVSPGFTYTDGDTVLLSNEGTPICLMSLPLRYMHSSIETASLKDIENCIQLLTKFLLQFNQNDTFI